MGNYFTYYGIERIFDKDTKIIDLRLYTKTDKNGFCNVFYTIISNRQFLVIYHLSQYFSLGYVVENKENDPLNPNHSIVTVNSGRKYIIHTHIDSKDMEGKNIKNIENMMK